MADAGRFKTLLVEGGVYRTAAFRADLEYFLGYVRPGITNTTCSKPQILDPTASAIAILLACWLNRLWVYGAQLLPPKRSSCRLPGQRCQYGTQPIAGPSSPRRSARYARVLEVAYVLQILPLPVRQPRMGETLRHQEHAVAGVRGGCIFHVAIMTAMAACVIIRTESAA
jgi:hypothetical protein